MANFSTYKPSVGFYDYPSKFNGAMDELDARFNTSASFLGSLAVAGAVTLAAAVSLTATQASLTVGAASTTGFGLIRNDNAGAYLKLFSGTHSTTPSRVELCSFGSTGVRIQASAVDVAAFTNNTVQLAMVTSGNKVVRIGGSPAANDGARLEMIGSNTATNWAIATNWTSAGSLEFQPSTAGGGSTFNTPVGTLSSAGALTIMAGLTATTVTGSGLGIFSGMRATTNQSSPGDASFYRNSTTGLTLQGVAGSSYDVTIINPGNASYIARVPTGTLHLELFGDLRLDGISGSSGSRRISLLSDDDELVIHGGTTGSGTCGAIQLFGGSFTNFKGSIWYDAQAGSGGTNDGTHNFRVGGTTVVRVTATGFGVNGAPDHSIGGLTTTSNILATTSLQWVVGLKHINATNPYGIGIFYSAAAPNSASSQFIYCTDSAAQRFAVGSHGGIANYSANDTNLSDERVKRRIENMPSYWNEWKAMRSVWCRYHIEDQKHSDWNYGYTAQRIRGVFGKTAPELVDEVQWGRDRRLVVYNDDLKNIGMAVLSEACEKIDDLIEFKAVVRKFMDRFNGGTAAH